MSHLFCIQKVFETKKISFLLVYIHYIQPRTHAYSFFVLIDGVISSLALRRRIQIYALRKRLFTKFENKHWLNR